MCGEDCNLSMAEGRSETMSTLHALRDKGVKVDLGIPDEMWDNTPAEITKLRLKVQPSHTHIMELTGFCLV